jgi:hypothetical protein
MTVDPQTLQIGDRVVPTGRYLYADLVCTVVAIQRLRFRAEVKWPDGPAAKSCGWTVFTHGGDARDKAVAA